MSPAPVPTNSDISCTSREDVSSTSSASLSASSASLSTSGGSSGETHTCPYADCRKSFSKKYNLKAHLRLHTGEQPFECDRPDCRKKFKWRSSLSSHSVWHNRKENGTASASEPKQPSPSSKEGTAVKSEPRLTKATTRMPTATQPVDPLSGGMGKKSGTAYQSNNQGKAFLPPSSSNASLPSQVQKKKRPRSDAARPTKSGIKGKGTNSKQLTNITAGLPVLSEVSFGVDYAASFDANRSVPVKVASLPAAKKRKTNVAKVLAPSSTCDEEVLAASEDTAGSPGSPVTTDGGLPEDSLDLDLFSCDVLPPLIGGGNDALGLAADDVGAIIGGDEDGEMFSYPSPSVGPLNGLDTKFGPFELENLQSFCSGKVEAL